MNATRRMCLLATVVVCSAIALGCGGGGGGGGSTNAPPAASDDAGTTPESTPIAFTSAELTANDVDAAGQSLTVIGVGNATLGTVALAAGTATFTPALGAAGIGTFEYTVSDGALTDTARVSITITAVAGPCGDTAGPDGIDVRCSCGDTVVTDTVLASPIDPVSTTTCAGDGLTVGAGRSMDLAGLAIAGSGAGTGVSISGGTIANGTVRGFGTGMSVAGTDGTTVVSALEVALNAGVGIDVAVVGPTARIHLDDVTVQGNGGDGIHVRAAPGSSNLDDALQNLDATGYGVSISSLAAGAIVRDNGGAGIHIGAADQPADAAVKVWGVQVFGNAGAGLVLEQDSDVPPGADCGESAGQPGCAGATLLENVIHDNGGAGVELRSGFLVPLYQQGIVELGLGFVANHVFHNAMGAGCMSGQTSPQIHVTGPVGLGNATCGTAMTPDACSGLNSPSNRHCVWTGTRCVVAWDLRGDASADCSSSFTNAIYDYDVLDAAAVSVGLRASNSSFVTAEHNEWRMANVSQNASADASSFVQAEATCGARGACSSP
jgi:hypothetical protein